MVCADFNIIMAWKLFTLTFLAVFIGQSSTQQNLLRVQCGVQSNVITETDPIHHRYIPFITRLPRCGGVFRTSPPSITKCVKKTAKNVTYNVRLAHNYAEVSIQIEHDETCMHECTLKPSACNTEHQTWDQSVCKCQCNYATIPSPSPCKDGKIWKQSTCSCGCPMLPTGCPINKEWNEDVCGCTCTKRYENRCIRKQKAIKQQDCSCIAATIPYLNNTAAARQSPTTCTGTSSQMVVMIVVLEFLFLLVLFVFVYRCYLRPNPDLDPNVSSLKRVRYEINQTIGRFSGRKKAKQTSPSTAADNGNVERPLTPTGEKKDNFSVSISARDESKEAMYLNDEPVGFYADQVYDNWDDTATENSLHSGTGRITVV